eukprot:TRINITY_DN1418_c2_g1_i1.p1 TRINITY_DN1418_c2_g1~~TRINITY_DN1418_c2_g1_i1.p1  ORF type:complete len:851 (+),score=210.19 TRINITY_DN1418_c2_g1_i1:90-2642(+)
MSANAPTIKEEVVVKMETEQTPTTPADTTTTTTTTTTGVDDKSSMSTSSTSSNDSGSGGPIPPSPKKDDNSHPVAFDARSASLAAAAAVAASTHPVLQSAPVVNTEIVPATTTTTTTTTTTDNTTTSTSLATRSTPMVVSQRQLEAEERVSRNKYDVDAWVSLVREAQRKPVEDARVTYERFLKIFPTAGRYWKYYVESELKEGNYDEAAAIFARCLMIVPSMDLWTCYVDFVKQQQRHIVELKEGEQQENPQGTEEQRASTRAALHAQAKDTVINAYEFAVEHMRLDAEVTPLWTGYLQYLRDLPGDTKLEKSQRMTAMRKVYHRAVAVPMRGVEAMWKEYAAFENGLNTKNTKLADALLEEHSAAYTSARVAVGACFKYTNRIEKNLIALPAENRTVKRIEQVVLWKRLIEYEKSDPQNRNDVVELIKRVSFVYRQCLLNLYHFPEIWHDFFAFLVQHQLPEQAKEVLQQAITAMPGSLLLVFTYAEFLEKENNTADARLVYEQYLDRFEAPSPLAFIQFMRFAHRAEGAESARKVFLMARKSSACDYHVWAAAALMEYHVNNDAGVARRIFEVGMKKLPREVEFVLIYIKFLSALNDDRNLRTLFETVLTTLPAEATRRIWPLFLDFEYQYGSLTSIAAVEQRRMEANKEMDPTGIFTAVRRYRHLDLWPCSSTDLAFFGTAREQDVVLDSSLLTANSSHSSSSSRKKTMPRPDTSTMVLYCPEMPPAGAQVMSSATPPSIRDMLKRLPSNYGGPPVPIDTVMMWVKEAPMPDRNTIAQSSQNGSRKRKAPESSLHDQEDRKKSSTSSSTTSSSGVEPSSPPSSSSSSSWQPRKDVFRSRRVAKMGR